VAYTKYDIGLNNAMHIEWWYRECTKLYKKTIQYHVLHEIVIFLLIPTRLYNIVVKNVQNLESPPI